MGGVSSGKRFSQLLDSDVDASVDQLDGVFRDLHQHVGHYAALGHQLVVAGLDQMALNLGQLLERLTPEQRLGSGNAVLKRRLGEIEPRTVEVLTPLANMVTLLTRASMLSLLKQAAAS